MLARTVATLDHMLKGRLTLNVISSDFPGQKEDSSYRYRRSHEVVEILRQAWTRETIDYEGEIYRFAGLSTDPARPYQQNGGPLLYFGGYSPDALELCGAQCDVYLMWPEPKEQLAERMRAVHARAARARPDAGLRAAGPCHRARHRGRGAGLRRKPDLQARRRIRPADPRARARRRQPRRQPPGPRPRARRPVRLCRAPPLDRDRPGALGLRRRARRIGRPGAVRAGGVPQDGHSRLHPVGLPASGRMPRSSDGW